MKYDVEYDSYKFTSHDIITIVKALDFYNQYSPIVEQKDKDYILNLCDQLDKTKNILINR